MLTLAERFMANDGKAVDVDGRVVINMYRRRVALGQRILIGTSSTINSPVQGFKVKLTDGVVRINDQALKEAVIWLDSAPPEFFITCEPKKPESELRIWNCWRAENGVTQAWIGNAGIVAEETNDQVFLHCSTGLQEFNPDQLTISLRF